MGTSASRARRGRETPPGGWAALRSAQAGGDPAVITLRTAQAGDLDAVTAIERESFSDAWSEGSFRSLLGRREVTFVVAVVARDGVDEVAGYAVAYFAADQGEITNLAVKHECRRAGLGTRLLEFVTREAIRRGAASIWLEVRESNTAARALYRAHGYHEVGRRARYYEHPVEDALVLTTGLKSKGRDTSR
ncbi:MAG: ribosomal protein S18-alanine N-acetyltransferase [Gemmatimonadaceae bacterium]